MTAEARGLTVLSDFLPTEAPVANDPDLFDVPLRPRLRELEVPPVTADFAPARLLSLLSGAAAQRWNLEMSPLLCKWGDQSLLIASNIRCIPLFGKTVRPGDG